MRIPECRFEKYIAGINEGIGIQVKRSLSCKSATGFARGYLIIRLIRPQGVGAKVALTPSIFDNAKQPRFYEWFRGRHHTVAQAIVDSLYHAAYKVLTRENGVICGLS